MFRFKHYVLLCLEKADNLDCRLFFFFFLGFGLRTSARKRWFYYSLFVKIISGVLKIYTEFLIVNLFMFWLRIFYMQAGWRPAKSIYSTPPLILTKNGRRGGINSVSDWELKQKQRWPETIKKNDRLSILKGVSKLPVSSGDFGHNIMSPRQLWP